MAARHISNFIIVNGKPFPAPKRYPNMVVTTAVNSARNANNKVVGQKIGRDNYKIDNLEWAYLDAETWSDMLKEFKKFFVTVKFWDMVENTEESVFIRYSNRVWKQHQMELRIILI